jgi:hypothetical protein
VGTAAVTEGDVSLRRFCRRLFHWLLDLLVP